MVFVSGTSASTAMTVDARFQNNYAISGIRYDPRSNRATVVIVAAFVLHAQRFKCFISVIWRQRADRAEDKLSIDIVVKERDGATARTMVLGAN